MTLRWLMSEKELNAWLSAGRFTVLPALLLLVLAVWQNWFGLLIAFFLLGFGASCEALRKYRTERGLWMLAMTFAVPLVLIWAAFAVAAFRGGGSSSSISLLDALEFAGVTALLGLHCRLLSSVVHHNLRLGKRQMSRPSQEVPTDDSPTLG